MNKQNQPNKVLNNLAQIVKNCEVFCNNVVSPLGGYLGALGGKKGRGGRNLVLKSLPISLLISYFFPPGYFPILSWDLGSVNLIPTANASILDLREVSTSFRSNFPGGHDPLVSLPGKEPAQVLELTVNSDIYKYFYWNNLIHAGTDRNTNGNSGGQFRSIGWQFSLGVRVTPALSIEYQHHSQHVLDSIPGFHFPVLDAIGVRFNLYQAPSPPAHIF